MAAVESDVRVDPVAALEELFRYRYTENDADYKKCKKRRKRMYEVPVISPWPPPPRSWRPKNGPRRKYADWDKSDDNHRHQSDYSPPQHHRTYHSDHRPPYEIDHKTPDNQPSQQRDYDTQEEDTNNVTIPHQPTRELEATQASIPTDSINNTPTDNTMTNILNSMQLETTDKPPTDSDIQAILSTAHSGSNKIPLNKSFAKQKKKVERPKHQQTTEQIIPTSKRKTLNEGLVVNHGHPKSVTASILLDNLDSQRKRKRRRGGAIINDESDEDEIIDPVKVGKDTLELSNILRQDVAKQEQSQSAFYHEPESLKIRIDLDSLSQVSGQTPSLAVDEDIPAQTESTDDISTAVSVTYSSAVTVGTNRVVLRLSKPLETGEDCNKKRKKKKKKNKDNM